MRIKLYEDAAKRYMQDCYQGVRNPQLVFHSTKWLQLLMEVQGRWLDVETEYLFKDQFNTSPIEGSPHGLRIMEDYVEEIQEDARVGMAKCEWCWKHQAIEEGDCRFCGRTGTMKPLLPKKRNTRR